MKANTSFQPSFLSRVSHFVSERFSRKWMLGLATLLFMLGTATALYQPVHPDPWHVHSSWDTFFYPQEKNAFLRHPAISQAINDVIAIGDDIWAVGVGGLILHSNNGGQCWETQGPWAKTEGIVSCPQVKTGLHRIFSGLSAQLDESKFLDKLTFPVHAAEATRAPLILDQKTQQTIQQALPLSKRILEPVQLQPEQAIEKVKSAIESVIQCGGLNQRPCTIKESPSPCNQGLTQNSTGNRCITLQAEPEYKQNTAAVTPVETDAIPDLRAIAFFDQKSGIAVGDFGTIVSTNDGGNSWQVVNSNTQATLYAIAIANNTVIAGGNNGVLLRSTDQGNEWKTVASDTRDSIESIKLSEDGRLYAIAANQLGNNSSILLSTDTGQSWTTAGYMPNLTFQDLIILENQQLLVSTSNGTLLVSGDGGNSWQRKHRENGISLRSITRINNSIVVAGSNGTILISSDNAQSWQSIAIDSSVLLTSIITLNNEQLLASGSHGTLVKSTDQGHSWRFLTQGTRGELSAIASLDRLHLTTVGKDGVTLYSKDGGNSWMPARKLTNAQLLAITSSRNTGYIAAGEQGVILPINDSGELREQVSSNVNVRLYAITQLANERFIAVGDRGTLLISNDAGLSWKQVETNVTTSLQAVAAVGNNRIIITGEQGTLLLSQDAGESWSKPRSITDNWLLNISAANNMLVATGYDGTIMRSDDAGSSWRSLSSAGNEWLNAVLALSPDLIIAVGSGGSILRSDDGGENWQSIAAGTTNNLNAITRLPNNYLFVAGSGGVLLRSMDGGQSWQPIDKYSVTLAYWWYLLLFLIMGLILFIVWPRVEFAEDEGIAGLAASDRPLQPGDPDALNLSAIASDITTFLSNPKTTAPLTMAITGPWGSGKSSLMNLVRAELKGRGFSPVWFNAWHHQKGEQLLASLFAHIKQQAIPAWFSFDGLWFRIKLAYIRGRRHWFIFAIMLALLFLTLSFNKQELTSLFVKLSLLADPKMWWQVPWQQWTPNIEALFSGADWIQTLASLFGIGTPLVALLRSIRGFGTSPKRLVSIDHAKDNKGGYDPGARARFASEFRDVTQALGNNKMVIFIDDLDRCSQANLIDILENINFIASSGDCFMLLGMAPKYIEACVANHYETLARSIAEKEKHESRNHSDDLETHKFRFAHNYLEKMINIEITIPQMQPNSIDQLLNPSLEDTFKPLWQSLFNTSARSLSQALNIIIPVTFILLAIGTGWEYGRKIPDKPIATPPPIHDLWPADKATLLALASGDSNDVITQKLTQQYSQQQPSSTPDSDSPFSIALQASKQQLEKGIKIGSLGQGNNRANLLLKLNPQSSKVVVSGESVDKSAASSSKQPEQKGSGVAAEFRQQSFENTPRISALWLLFSILMFVSFAFYLYRKKTEKYAEDSDDFKTSLTLWTPWIQLKQETPRAVKRFLNHLRFLAIRNHREMHESLLVAMATIYFYNPEWLLDEQKFRAICDSELYPLLESDYRLQQQDREQQENLKTLLSNLSQRLSIVLKEVNIDELCKHRDQAIKILGGALPVEQNNESDKDAPAAQSAERSV